MGEYEVWIWRSGFDLDNQTMNRDIKYLKTSNGRLIWEQKKFLEKKKSDRQEMKTDGFSHMYRETKTDGINHRYLIWIRLGMLVLVKGVWC